MTRRTIGAPIAVVAVAGVILAGCGGSGRSSSSQMSSSNAAASSSAPAAGGGQVVPVTAAMNRQLRFTMASLSVPKPGKVTLRMLNPASSGVDHGIAVEGNGVDKDGPTVAPGQTSSVTVTLKKGTYTYYCPVPGHKQAGMMGTLKVG